VGALIGGIVGAGDSLYRKVSDPSISELSVNIDNSKGDWFWIQNFLEFSFKQRIKKSFNGTRKVVYFMYIEDTNVDIQKLSRQMEV